MYAFLEKLDRDCIDFCFILFYGARVLLFIIILCMYKANYMKILVMWHPHLFITAAIFIVGLLEICNVIMANVFGNIILGHCFWQYNFELV